jgi:hypothetical protein
LSSFGEKGWFGGLARFAWSQEGRENRAVTERNFVHIPREGSRALDFTKCGQEPNGIKLIESLFLSTVRGMHALGSLLATRAKWIEPYAVTREPKLACDNPDHAERHAKH